MSTVCMNETRIETYAQLLSSSAARLLVEQALLSLAVIGEQEVTAYSLCIRHLS